VNFDDCNTPVDDAERKLLIDVGNAREEGSVLQVLFRNDVKLLAVVRKVFIDEPIVLKLLPSIGDLI
jgi:hypothetical protein